MMVLPRCGWMVSFAALALMVGAPVSAQDDEPDFTLEVTPKSLEMNVGDEVQLEARVLDADGKEIELRVIFFSRKRRAVSVNREGKVLAVKPGEYTIVARTARRDGKRRSLSIPVDVAYPPLASVELVVDTDDLHVGTTSVVGTRIIDESGAERDNVIVKLSSTAPNVASIDDFGNVTCHGSGAFTIVAECEGLKATRDMRSIDNPVKRIELSTDYVTVRTGDVIHLAVKTMDASGGEITGVPVQLSFHAKPDDALGPAATGQIEQDGRFVAAKPGIYTIVASCGNAVAQKAVRANAREVAQKVELVGRGAVTDVHTSDLWVWEGVDGRDYAVTGTWGANGEAHFWDVTDPGDIKRISTVTVDARTVNDVKVSEDGTICVLSREGASNRKNGIVIVDVKDPSNPEVISEFTDELTGGVHNVFIYQNHVFALSAGRRYDIINIEDPKNPHRVGQFELESRGHSIHDVWVEDGLAYSSNWQDGVVIVDVGNGVKGGTVEKPVLVGEYAYPSGWNHAAFPYKNEATGKFYVIAGDEAFPYGLNVQNKPTYPRGWLHFIDFTDPENPKEVARYEVPEAGTHNLWVEGDKLYVAYYNGGVRVVDISGDLMGDLYEQGREIGAYIPTDHEGYVPNAPMTWGPQPYKGHVFMSDWNSGLWAVKLESAEN